MLKSTKNVCWRCTHKACGARIIIIIERRDGTVVEECGFHCHAEKITVLNASATVLQFACTGQS